MVMERASTRTRRGTALAMYSGNADAANDKHLSMVGDRGPGHKKPNIVFPVRRVVDRLWADPLSRAEGVLRTGARSIWGTNLSGPWLTSDIASSARHLQT